MPRPWLVSKFGEIRTGAKASFVGYQFDLRAGRVQPTLDRWQSLQEKIQSLLLLPSCPVRQLMSLIGLLTATEKQVHLGRLHMRPIQWHLKNNWRIPESLEKVIPIPRALHPHLRWWLEESNVLQAQLLHPIKHVLQLFTDASEERWGAHLNGHTARGPWSLTRERTTYKLSGTKSSLSSLKRVPRSLFKQNSTCSNRQHHSSVIHKQGMSSGPLSALLFRILTWCTRKQVTLKARHIPGRLNVVADKLSRLGQTIQPEWSLLPEVFHAICSRWQIYLPQGSTTSCLCLCHQCQTPWPLQQMHSVCHGRIWMHMPSHQQPYWAK